MTYTINHYVDLTILSEEKLQVCQMEKSSKVARQTTSMHDWRNPSSMNLQNRSPPVTALAKDVQQIKWAGYTTRLTSFRATSFSSEWGVRSQSWFEIRHLGLTEQCHCQINCWHWQGQLNRLHLQHTPQKNYQRPVAKFQLPPGLLMAPCCWVCKTMSDCVRKFYTEQMFLLVSINILRQS